MLANSVKTCADFFTSLMEVITCASEILKSFGASDVNREGGCYIENSFRGKEKRVQALRTLRSRGFNVQRSSQCVAGKGLGLSNM